MQLLKGKSALITGGTAGIGKAIAILFAEQGAHVAIFGTNKERAEQAVREIEQARANSEQKVTFSLVDVSQSKDVETAIQGLLSSFGHIDTLVNNAGITRDGLLMKMSEEDWDLVVAVNLKSIYNTCRVLTRPMMKMRGGSIINISSAGALRPRPQIAPYAGAKAALNALTEAFAVEYGPKVRVNTISPGRFLSDVSKAWSEEAKRNDTAALKRSGRPFA